MADELRLKSDNGQQTIWLNGAGGNATVGGNGFDGALTLTNAANGNRVLLHGGDGSIRLDPPAGNMHDVELLSGAGTGGIIRLYHPIGGNPHVELIANEVAPDNNGGGLVNVTDGEGNITIRLNGNAGTIEARDILLTRADCAEDFDLAAGDSAEPGSVMVLDYECTLRESNSAYDRKVAGVISGAGDYKPGVILGRQSHASPGRMPLALNGRVFCKVDASYEPIDVGDLLVTSPTPAHAMKGSDPARAFGAVIGKALRALDKGSGLIPILVSLQ